MGAFLGVGDGHGLGGGVGGAGGEGGGGDGEEVEGEVLLDGDEHVEVGDEAGGFVREDGGDLVDGGVGVAGEFEVDPQLGVFVGDEGGFFVREGRGAEDGVEGVLGRGGVEVGGGGVVDGVDGEGLELGGGLFGGGGAEDVVQGVGLGDGRLVGCNGLRG